MAKVSPKGWLNLACRESVGEAGTKTHWVYEFLGMNLYVPSSLRDD